MLLSAFIFFPSLNYAQNNITGYVIDAKDNTPVKWAVVKVYSFEDTSVVSAAETDISGGFTIFNLKTGGYIFTFFSTGYIKRKIKFDYTGSGKFIDTVKLYPSEYSTDVVNVESEIPEMRLEGDKKIFGTERMISTQGGTALDVLRRIPMIDVDLNDNVRLRGSTNAAILIDNKPMKFTSLRQLPANAIKDIEIITTPSAKYEAEGVTGIINIVTVSKNFDFTGYHGYLNTGARSNFNSGNADAGVNLKSGKIEYFISGGYYRTSTTTDANSLTGYRSTGNSYLTLSNIDERFNIWFLSLGAEYIINNKNSIGADISDNYVDFINTNTGNNRNINSSGITTLYTELYVGNKVKAHNYSASIYYTGKYDKNGRELDAEIAFTGNPGDGNTETIRQSHDTLFLPVYNPYIQRQTTESNYKTFMIRTDYTHPFGENTLLETGYKGSFITNENNYSADTLDYNTGNYVKDYSVINHFKLINNVNGLYAAFTHKINDFGIKIGVRLEHTHINGELLSSDDVFKRNYFNVFPTLNLTQKIGSENQFQLSYSRRITRPFTWRYNPFVNRSDPKNISFGNPELSPELTDSYEVTHSYYGKLFSLSSSLFYRKSYDVISLYTFLTDSLTTATTYRNEGSAKFYGADFVLSSSLFKWWSISASLSVYKSMYENAAADDTQGEEGTALKGKIRSNIKLKGIIDLDIFYNYRGKRITVPGFIEPSGSLDIGISRSFFNKKLRLSIRAKDVFNTYDWNSEQNGEGLHTRFENKENSRAFFINISYFFGNTKEYYEKSKESKSNENESPDTRLK